MNEIADILREIVGAAPKSTMVAKVVSVQDYSCTVQDLLNDVEIKGVRLNAGVNSEEGIIITPEENSIVLIASISETDHYVVMFSKIKSVSVKIANISVEMNDNEIKLNGGQANSYLTDINKLVGKINAVETDLNKLKALLAAWVPAPTDGGLALKTALAAYYSSTITPTLVADIKDGKVKH